MKKIAKKMNLGILLAAILMLGTIAYIIISSIVIRSKKDELKTFIGGYIDECCQANIGNASEMIDKQKELVNKYFAENEVQNVMHSDDDMNIMNDAEEMLNTLSAEAEDLAETYGEVIEYKAEIKDIEVEKKGLNCAELKVEVKTVLSVKGTDVLICESGLPHRVTCSASAGKDSTYNVTIESSFRYILSPDGSSWKIDSVRRDEEDSGKMIVEPINETAPDDTDLDSKEEEAYQNE